MQRHSGCPLQSRGSPGDISNYGAIILIDTIVADNANASCFNEGARHSAGHNLDGGDTCGFGSTGDLTDTNPQLGPLQDNGGLPTSLGQTPWTHALHGGGPAIDAGPEVGCPATDQRGIARPMDGDFDDTARCDVGAYEFELIEVYLPLTARRF